MTAAAKMNILIDTRTGKTIDLAMQKLEVTGRVYPIGSFVRVTHRFRCMGTQPMEAIYVSALPTGGTLRRFKVIGENFEVDSKLEPRKKARQEYEAGVADGHLSVLAETNQDGLVHLSVGQVQPDEKISVVMDVVVGATTRDKGFSFRYPFTLAPNYHASARMTATESGGKIELAEDVFGDLTMPEWKNSAFGLHEVSFNILVFGGTNLMTVSSPSHRISVAPQADGSSLVSLAGMGDTPNRDLVIDVSVPEAAPLLFADATVLGDAATGNEPSVPQGAGRWTALMPSTTFTKGGRQPRKVVFVLDRSGSMTGSQDHDPHAPILGAKKALLACLSILEADDDFGIVHFGSDAVTFHPTLAKADDTNRKKATAWVEAIQCAGGTEMLGALAAATRVLGGPGGDVVILTDGEVFQTGPIVEHMAASQSRVHVLGIGTASQHRFMAQLARRTGGVCEMVAPAGDVGITGLKLFNQVKEPVLSDPTIKVDGKDLPNGGTVWEGLPLLVTDPTGDGSLPGTVLVAGQVVTDFVHVKVPDGLTALLWAGRQIEDLGTKMDMVGPGTPKRDIIEKQMEDLSVGYGLASRVMSLVAVVERIGDAAGVTPEQKIVAVGIPEGMDQGFFGGQQYASPGVFFGVLSESSTAGSMTRGRSMSKGISGQSLSLIPNYKRGDAQAYSMSITDSANASLEMTPISDFGLGEASTYDENEWAYSGNLLVDLGDLRADGGLPGYSMSERVMNTILLALIVSLEAKMFPGVYDKHLDRMVAFIKVNEDAVNDKITMHKVLTAIRTGSESSKNTLVGYFGQDQSTVLLALRASF